MPTPPTPTTSPAVASATPATAASSPPFHLLGRLPFVGDRLLAELAAEAERQRPDGSPGPVLRRLAVSRQVREAVGEAVGTAVVPTYNALYQYHEADTRLRPHRDRAGYDIVFHLTVTHRRPASTLHIEGHGDVPLPHGESLVLRGRDVLHGWAPLTPGERRTLVAVGFTDTRRDAMSDAPLNEDVEGEDAEAAELEDLTPEGESADEVTGGATARPLR